MRKLDYETPEFLPAARGGWMWIIAPAKFELWVSMGLVFVWTFGFPVSRPSGPGDTISSSIVATFAWIMVLNAIADFRRMAHFERVIALIWFPLMTFVAITVLYRSFTTTAWADR